MKAVGAFMPRASSNADLIWSVNYFSKSQGLLKPTEEKVGNSTLPFFHTKTPSNEVKANTALFFFSPFPLMFWE